jgi:hypothetical protein
MLSWFCWAILGLPFAYFLEKKYHRGWFISLMAGMGIAIFIAIIIGFAYALFQSS